MMPGWAHFEAAYHRPLIGGIDVDALIASVPEAYTICGMFFNPLITQLGDIFSQIQPNLKSSPPPTNRYLPFKPYPMRDFLRVFDRAARKTFPTLPDRQAHRLLARTEVEVFAQSTLGKVTFSLVTDPATALLRYPESFGVMIKGPTVNAIPCGADAVRVEFKDYFGSVEYPLGVIEALVWSFQFEPTIEVTVADRASLSFLVHLSKR